MILPHAIALGIMLILWLPLCCCCAWPGIFYIIKKNIQFAANAENLRRKAIKTVNLNGLLISQ